MFFCCPFRLVRLAVRDERYDADFKTHADSVSMRSEMTNQ